MILVVVEHAEGAVSRSTRELLTAARNCGREGPVAVLMLGSNVGSIAASVANYSDHIDQVLVADMGELATYDAELWAAAVAQIAAEGEANLVLIAGSRSGREYSPRVAVKLDAPLVEDAISLTSGEHGSGVLRAEHYIYLRRVTETLETEAPIVVATVQSGAFEPAQTSGGAPAEQFDVDLNLPPRRLQVTARTSEKSKRVALADADIVVAGGRRLGSAEDFARLVEGLADQIGAAVGATRAVVDAGWRPYAEQVGQTGKTVQPKVYVAVGIAGAVQHLSGMNKSKLIVAINKDADAPIFAIADYGIVGDAKQVVPALLEELRK